MRDYLAFCSERGEEPDRSFTGRFTIRLSPDQHKKVIMSAEKAGKNVESWITEILAQVVD